jgi:hypothetical protein
MLYNQLINIVQSGTIIAWLAEFSQRSLTEDSSLTWQTA